MKMATIFSAKYYQENKDCKKNLVKKNTLVKRKVL